MNLYDQAIKRFQSIHRDVIKSRLIEPTAMALATADKSGWPSVRIVLLKEVDARGFVFYTNMRSRKGRELASNRRAALCFFWDSLDWQIRVEGRVEIVSEAEADLYWSTRPRQSQLAAWASQQSQPLAAYKDLQKRVAALRLKYINLKIPRPPHWSGYRVVPDRIEFWKRRPFRLHERLVYMKKGPRWSTSLLNP